MVKFSDNSTTRIFEELLSEGGSGRDHYTLNLYVTGMTPRSTQAISRIKEICDEYLAGRYELSIIDIYQQPGVALEEQIVASPTLIKRLPPPLRRIVGDMSNKERVMISLDLRKV